MTEEEKSKELKEQRELIDELLKIERYKKSTFGKSERNAEVQDFIDEIVNKYRGEAETKNYYNNPIGKDSSHWDSQFDTLCSLEKMLRQYAIIKFGEDFFDKKES